VTFFWNVSDFLHSHSDLSRLPDILGTIKEQEKVRQVIKSRAQQGTVGALWLQVLLNLSLITIDRRAELRNTAIQTIQRIFENYVDQISSKAWMICLRSVLFGMVESNLAAQKNVRSERRVSDEDIAAWNDTTKMVLDSVGTLTSMCLDKLDNTSKLGEAWSDLLDYLKKYFLYGSHTLGSSVFVAITGVLSRVEDPRVLGMSPLLKTATMWKQYFDHRDAWKDSREDNQTAFVAYADAFKAIYKLTGQFLSASDLTQMLRNLGACIVDSDEVPYSSDVDQMTALQTRVLECFSTARSEGPELPEFIVRTLSSFAVLPYSVGIERSVQRGPTFVALSKASMSLLQTVIIKNATDETIGMNGALLFAMTSLTKPLDEKYTWQQEGKPPTIWQKATTTALAILEANLAHVNTLEKEELWKVWEQIANIARGITHAQILATTPQASLSGDEAFDIGSFTKLRDLITNSLGSTSLPDALRQSYTRNLFETSIIYEPSPGEIPDIEDSPLEDLYKIRYGRTDDPSSTFRPAMAYVCLTELFALTSMHNSSTERIKLAQAAAPYLILRAALPLRMYIADHPLRGRMPQPEGQRRELLFVLQELGRLKSEPAAIPNAPGVSSKHKKHLHRLYPLLVKATRVARNDGEVFEALISLKDMVGMEFGVLDE
jgi:hypothetical protein